MDHQTTPTYLRLTEIKVDTDCQARVSCNPDTVAEYADIMEASGDDKGFPPITVFHDGTDYWLSDGHHRFAAAEQASLPSIRAEVRQGSRRDAILFAVGANASHGLRRTNADKRRAVQILLDDPEWGTWSAVKIAEHCGVSDRFVGHVRKHTSNGSEYETRTYRHPKTGELTEMNVSRIGKKTKDEPTTSVDLNQPEGPAKDALDDLLSLAPVSDQGGQQPWLVKPIAQAKDQEPEQQQPNNGRDDWLLRELETAWELASEPVRLQFLTKIGAVLLRPDEAEAEAEAEATLSPVEEPAPAEAEVEPAITNCLTEPEENRLWTLWKDFKPNTQYHGWLWVSQGCEGDVNPGEAWTITERLLPFRAAARDATPAQRDEFLHLAADHSAVQAAY